MTYAVVREVGRDASGETSPCDTMAFSSEEIGHRIVAARKEKRWSRLDLATAMDVSPSSVYRWEIGKLPSVHELIRLAEVLDKPTDYLTEPPEHQATLVDLTARLEALEAAVAESVALTNEALKLLREGLPQGAGAQRARREASSR